MPSSSNTCHSPLSQTPALALPARLARMLESEGGLGSLIRGNCNPRCQFQHIFGPESFPRAPITSKPLSEETVACEATWCWQWRQSLSLPPPPPSSLSIPRARGSLYSICVSSGWSIDGVLMRFGCSALLSNNENSVLSKMQLNTSSNSACFWINRVIIFWYEMVWWTRGSEKWALRAVISSENLFESEGEMVHALLSPIVHHLTGPNYKIETFNSTQPLKRPFGEVMFHISWHRRQSSSLDRSACSVSLSLDARRSQHPIDSLST